MNTYNPFSKKAFCSFIAIAAITVVPCTVNAQTTESKTIGINVHEDAEGTKVEMPGVQIKVSNFSDTVTIISLGKRKLEVIENNGNTHVKVSKTKHQEFKGHYSGFDLGINQLATSGLETTLMPSDRFMELYTGKSINVGINFVQHSIGLQKNKTNLGLVTGAGLNISNYRFNNPYLLKRDPLLGDVYGEPVLRDIKKNKLVTSYINIPLLLEYQTSNNKKPFYVSAGGFVGFKVGSHTKIVYSDSDRKYKSHDNLNLSAVQYGLMGRIGFDFLKLHASYNYSTLFEKNKGPELYPFTVGVTLTNF